MLPLLYHLKCLLVYTFGGSSASSPHSHQSFLSHPQPPVLRRDLKGDLVSRIPLMIEEHLEQFFFFFNNISTLLHKRFEMGQKQVLLNVPQIVSLLILECLHC